MCGFKKEILMFTAIKVTLVGLINLSYCVQAQALMAFYDKLCDLVIVCIERDICRRSIIMFSSHRTLTKSGVKGLYASRLECYV